MPNEDIYCEKRKFQEALHSFKDVNKMKIIKTQIIICIKKR